MNGSALLALQILDTQLDQLAGERRRLPERAVLAAATAQLDSWKAADARLRGAIATAVEVITEAERQGATLDAKRSRLDAQLRTVSNERQADALTHEIATLVQQHSELDDRELAAMEAQAEAEAALEELTSNRDRLAAAVDEATADLERALGRIAAEEAEVNRRRPDAVAALTDAELALYTTLRTRFGGVGITQLEGRRCGGCHLDLSASEADQVHRAPADELPECPHCGRLIVR